MCSFSLSSQLSTACDVWSLGVVLWEMSSGDVPYQGLCSEAIEDCLVMGTALHHLQVSPHWDPAWAALIRSCLQYDPRARWVVRVLARVRVLVFGGCGWG